MHITYTVLFSGTDHLSVQENTLLNLLKNHIDLRDNQISTSFNGCGIDYGFTGAIFGAGLDKQCQIVIERVLAEIQKGNKVTLNAYGLSRGAVAALLLAKQLGSIDPELLEINLALLDPVPGNSLSGAALDPFEISLANKTVDLSESKNLKRVLALYPHIPLSAILCHAPLIVNFPDHTEQVQDAIAGCHAGAQYHSSNQANIIFSRQSFISFARIYSFLKESGTQFKPFPPLIVQEPYFEVDLDQLDEALRRVYQAENIALNEENHAATDRATHSQKGIIIKTKESAEYFNVHHQHLSGQNTDESNARVTIEKDQSILAKIARTTLKYPQIWQATKWTILSLSLASLIIFTGGFGLIPVAASLLTPSVLAVSMLILTPIAALTLAGLWHGIVKPLSEWTVNKLYYPQFKIRQLAEVIPDESTESMLHGLGEPGKNTHRVDAAAESSYSYKHPIKKRPSRETNFDLIATNQEGLDLGSSL